MTPAHSGVGKKSNTVMSIIRADQKEEIESKKLSGSATTWICCAFLRNAIVK